MNKARKQIGIFGGSFDPIHKGHVAMALAAQKQFELGELHFVLAKQSPLKSKSELGAEKRYQLLEKVVEQLNSSLQKPKASFKTSRLELDREGPSYTCDTVAEYRKLYPEAELNLLLGADAFYDFNKWKNHEYIKENCALIILPRLVKEGEAPHNKQELGEFLKKTSPDPKIKILDTELKDIESRLIREQISHSNKDCLEDVPESIKDIVFNLY